MKRLWIVIMLFVFFPMRTSAMQIEAPDAPPAAREYMPEDTSDFGSAVLELLKKSLYTLRPDFADASRLCLSAAAGVILISLLKAFSGSASKTADLAGTLLLAAPMFGNVDSLIQLAGKTVNEMSEYGKLLLPVMTAAMAAQGAGVSSTTLYTGTAVFDMILSSLISGLLVPLVYVFLALALANGALGEDILKKMKDFIKWLVSWCLKMILTIFTTYMSITGVVSGTTDAAALKAAKITISSVVPVVGGILSDASEAVLVSAGLMKNAAGIYGIVAILAVFLEPFLRIGLYYVLIKLTASVCGIFGTKRMADLVEDFSAAMGLLLAMTGSVCLLLLISTVCFLKGVG